MKIGIVADNYKVETFKKELNDAGFKYEITPSLKNTSLITIEAEKEKVMEIKNLCQRIELNLKHSN